MKKVIMPLSPQECERVFNGEQTILVRKRVPKIDTPYEVLVYMTATKERCRLWEYITAYQIGDKMVDGSQKVIGSFVCDGVEECVPDYDPYTETFFNYFFESGNDCLTAKEIRTYGKGDPLYGLHITKPKLFDTPKELSDYWLYNDELHKRWEEDNNFCCYDCTDENGEATTDCGDAWHNIMNCYRCWNEWNGWCRKLTHPLRSFAYVEDV